MSVENSPSPDVDLDRTDRLPILQGVEFADDVEDDAVAMEYSPIVPAAKAAEFPRAAGVDLPSLAESVRSVEERIARQNAEFEALSRSYEKAREAESAAVSKANVLASDLAGVRALLEAEQSRLHDTEKALVDKNELMEATRARIEEALREAGRYQSEARTLHDQLAARDASIAQVTHSLGERDAQLSNLQREHAQIVPVLEERSRVSAQLAADLTTERNRSAGLAEVLKTTQQSAASLASQLKTGDEAWKSTRRDLNLVKTQAASYLDQLRTREWRRGFEQNLYREMDARIGAVQDDRGALQRERDQLRQQIRESESKVAARDEYIVKLQGMVADEKEQRTRQDAVLARIEQSRAELLQRSNSVDGESRRLAHQVTEREQTIAELRSESIESDRNLRLAEQVRSDLEHQLESVSAERERLSEELSARESEIEELKTSAAADEATRAKAEGLLQGVERATAELTTRISALEKDKEWLNEELVRREETISEAKNAHRDESQRSREMQAAADKEHAELAVQIERLTAEMRERDGEKAALVAQLSEARRPLDPIEAEVKRLNTELAARLASIEQLGEDNKSLRAALERTRGALEEREFLIRRLERSESNNANVLGRIQTSIERLGAAGAVPAFAPAAAVECAAELIRVDGEHKTTHTLGRRTRIGRAPGCEMQIESSSVSRHHALVLMSTRDVIIEDLNSTNGVLVNGRKVSRQLLHDGDVVTIGDAQFRLSVKFAERALEHSAAGRTPPAGPVGT